MSQSVDRAATALFPITGRRVVNVKFYLNGTRCATGEQLSDQLERAEAQIRAGASTRILDVDNYRAA
jgi:hypothetical protein